MQHTYERDAVAARRTRRPGRTSHPGSMHLPHLAPTQREVYRSLLDYDRTAEQIAIDTGRSGNTVRPRLLELEKYGLIRRTRRTRRTLSGGFATIWEVV